MRKTPHKSNPAWLVFPCFHKPPATHALLRHAGVLHAPLVVHIVKKQNWVKSSECVIKTRTRQTEVQGVRMKSQKNRRIVGEKRTLLVRQFITLVVCKEGI